MWKKCLRNICALLVFLLAINFLIEIIPIHTIFNNLAKGDLSVMCYNVKCSDSLYKENQIEIAKQILRESPDIVFLCEFHRSKSRKLDSIMRQSGGYKQYYRSKSNCIFYSKYEIDSIVGINTNTSSGVRSHNNRIRILHPKGMVTIVGCHLSSSRKDIIGGIRNRALEADSIHNSLTDEKNPIIVMGDLNDVSGSYTISRIKELGLSDAWWEGGYGYGATFHNSWVRLRLDHILYDKSKLKLSKIKVLDSNLSDHNALIASFSFK